MTEVPPDSLDPQTLDALIEEFITRQGAVYGQREVSLAQQIEQVRGQLKRGHAIIVFDDESESCTIMPKDRPLPGR